MSGPMDHGRCARSMRAETWFALALPAIAALTAAAPLSSQDTGPFAAAVSDVAELPRPSLVATHATRPILLDGVLDEEVWSGASATRFLQAEPFEGTPATERTEVWVAYDESNLYIGAHLYDSDPAGIVVNDIRKDFNEFTQDAFSVILDTFHDRRNGYVFMTNPEGARGDRQIASEGREINASWDAIWRVETRRTGDGWTVEMEIPFRAIRSSPAVDSWGLNFSRNIRRKNEVAYWAPIPRKYNLMRLSLAGSLTSLPSEATSGRDLRIKPYVLGTTVRATGGTHFDRDGETGVDIKWGVTRGLTLDATVNPDFAQVEADEQRVNLTQFSLFFPEKREFFLENSGIFYVGDAARSTRVNLTPRRDEDLLPFFSRRIGLTDDGRSTPIRGGGRVTGKAGGFDIGAIGMRTGDVEGVPGSDWGVLRVRRNVFRSSDVGGLFMLRRGTTKGDQDFNRIYGADAYIRFPGEVDWSVYYLRSDARSLPVEGSESPVEGSSRVEASAEINGYTFRTSLNREGNFHHIKFGFMQMSPDFQNDLGFLRRTGFRKYFLDWGVRPRFDFMRRLGFREIHPHIVWNYYDDLDGRILAKTFHTGLSFFRSDGGFFEFSANPRAERIEDPFTIDRQVDPIPAGSYSWNEWMFRANTDASRLLSFGFRGVVGGLWSGTQRTFDLTTTIKPSYRFRATVGVSRTDADLESPDVEFVKTLWTMRTNYSFNRSMFVDALVQYDPSTELFNSNVRFNLIHRPLSDIYVVWNEQRVTTGDGTPPGRSLTVKMTYMLSL